MRCRSASTRGRSGGRSIRTGFLRLPLRNAVRARSTIAATSAGSGATDSVPVSMRAASSRSPIRACMWSACSSTMRKNSRAWDGSRAAGSPSAVAAQPLIDTSGACSSWLTMPRNSARSRSSSSRGVRSCRVTTSDSTAPSSARIAVALTSAVTLRPSGTSSTISSARMVVASLSICARPNPFSAISAPSARRTLSNWSRSSTERPGMRRFPTMRCASRLNDATRPPRASNTTTPTGEVSISASRSDRARCSSRYLRALASAAPASEANSARISSSSLVNSCPPSLSARKKLPTCTSR